MERHHAWEKKCIKKCVPGRASSIKWLITSTHTKCGGFTLWNLAFQSWNAKQCLPPGSPDCQKHVESGFFSQRTFCVLSGPSAERKEEGRTLCSKLVLCWFYWSVVIKGMGTSLFSVKSMVKGSPELNPFIQYVNLRRVLTVGSMPRPCQRP